MAWMSCRLGWVVCVLALCLGVPSAWANPIVADLSNYRISMDASFIGTRMFLFGARNDPGDVVVVVRGPEKNFMIRKKEKIAGMWVNIDRSKYYGVPDFYAIASSRPLEEIASPGLLARLGIGFESLLVPSRAMSSPEDEQQFARALMQHQQQKQLYQADPLALKFMAETLFKTTIPFPDTIPAGEYTAEIYLISGGEISGMQAIPIRVEKSGIDALVYHYAHHWPLFYGISAIIIALSAGWFAGRLFEKT